MNTNIDNMTDNELDNMRDEVNKKLQEIEWGSIPNYEKEMARQDLLDTLEMIDNQKKILVAREKLREAENHLEKNLERKRKWGF